MPRLLLGALLVCALLGAASVYLMDQGLAARLVQVILAGLAGAVIVGLLRRRTSNGVKVSAQPIPWDRILRTIAIACALLFVLGSVLIYVENLPHTLTTYTQLVSVGVFSGAVGYGELLSRSRDDPGRLLGADPTAIYVAFNIAAGIGALALVKEFTVFAGTGHQATYEALVASFGAIAFFRTSLFTARIGGTDVDVGPSTLLKSLLASSDFMVNRKQAGDRADEVRRTMTDVNFDKAKSTLTVLCFTLVEGVTDDQQKLVAEQIKKLADDTTIEPAAKSTILGVYLLRQVGADVLASAVEVLGSRIK